MMYVICSMKVCDVEVIENREVSSSKQRVFTLYTNTYLGLEEINRIIG